MKKLCELVIVFGLAVVGLSACGDGGGSACDGLSQDAGIACAENYQAP